MTGLSMPEQVREALIDLARNTAVTESERVALRQLAAIGADDLLIRLRALLR